MQRNRTAICPKSQPKRGVTSSTSHLCAVIAMRPAPAHLVRQPIFADQLNKKIKKNFTNLYKKTSI